ncbi:hypothetical protein HMPREF0105_2122 [Bacteroides sp. 3_1_33FAA]|uniref:Uncharacterized protein n=1 Tax=Phocaeicola dorei DSM 17855 TaxID=483217 RepID=B6VX52_9BACT|nr:hypothetical protein BACDOR_01745 [Phocaeicola dorei DSM 17855]EEZ21568.1 hypothetical protein HMPREF0105_2122 [Bacteroides sp. 3_1_33FAA]
MIDADKYKWTYCSCYYECLTEESAFLILTSILTKYVGENVSDIYHKE